MASAKAKESESNNSRMMLIAVIAVLALIVFMFSMGNHYLGPQPNHIAESMGNKIHRGLRTTRSSVKGLSKLSPAEQQKVIAFVKGSPHDASNEIALVWAGSNSRC